MLCVKTYLLTKSNEVSEIRRFSVPNSPTFASLVEKIRGIYNIQDSKPVRLQWLDTEGDRVVFSTDSELLDAVGSAEATGDRTLRIYASVQSTMSDVQHPNVLCDGCEHPVKGYRLKCVICQDFDLCCTCMALNKHCEHPMLLLRKPRDPFFCKFSRWQRCFWSRRPPAGDQQQQQQPADMCRQVMREIDRVAKRCAGLYSQRCQQQQQQQQQQQSHGSASAQASSCSSASFSYPDCSEAAHDGHNMMEMVHSVSSSLSSILHPLGIDVSYHADEQMQQQQREDEKPQKQQQQQQQQHCEPSHPAVEVPEDDAIVVDLAMSDACESSAPTLPDRVATALGQMKAMGFTDDNGQLTKLLMENDGNIDRVLDAIRQN